MTNNTKAFVKGEQCPLCGKKAQVQNTSVVSRHRISEVASTTVRSYRCSDPECKDIKGSAPSWRTSTEFVGWSALIKYDPLALQEKAITDYVKPLSQSTDQPG